MFIEYEYLLALLTVLVAGVWLAGLRNGERTRLPRIVLRGNFLRFKFGLFWRV